jgi:tetratricopeptide (TPR) repeat protein
VDVVLAEHLCESHVSPLMMKRLVYGWRRLPWGLALLSLLTYGCGGPPAMDRAQKLALARGHLRAERYYRALSLLHEIAGTGEHTAELYLMEALAYFKLEDYPQAAAALEHANPQSPMLQIFLAYLYLLVGDAGRASSRADLVASQYGALPELALLKGNISLAAQRHQEAEQHFRAMLALDQTAAKADIGLGHTALLQRRLRAAEEYYLRAVFLNPGEISPQLALVNFYLATQRYDDAEATLKLGLQRYPDDVVLKMALVKCYSKLNQNRSATALLEGLLTSMPLSDYIKVMVVRQYFMLGKLDDARQLINEILASDANNYYGLLLNGEYLLRIGDYQLALNYFQRSLMQNAHSSIANYYIGVIHLRSKNNRLATYFLEKSLQAYPSPPNAQLLLAAIHLQSYKYALAAEYTNAVLKVDPGNVNAHLLNGIVLYMQGHFDVATYEFDVVMVLDPSNPSAQVFHTLIEMEQHHLDTAPTDFSALAASVTEKIFLQTQLLQENRLESPALQQHLESSVDAAHDALAWLILGHAYHSRADYSHAEVAYRHAMTTHKANVLPYYAMAQLEVMRANRHQAIAYLEQAIATNPAFTKSYRALGSLYEQEHDYQQARTAYERGLRYAPDDPALLNNLAWVQMMPGGDMATAYVHIRKAVSLTPEDPDLQDTLAWWYYLTQGYAQAITLLKKIVEAQPAHPIYHYHLGMAYLQSGAHEQARQHLQQALDLGIDADYHRLIEEQMR